MPPLSKYMGRVIRTLRRDQGLSVEHMVSAAGVSEIYLSQIELGSKAASIDMYESITTELGITVNEAIAKAQELRAEEAP